MKTIFTMEKLQHVRQVFDKLLIRLQQHHIELLNIRLGERIGPNFLRFFSHFFFFVFFFSRNPSDTLRYNYLDNDDTVLESLIAKHRKSPSSKDRTRQSRTEEQQIGPKRRSQSLVR